MQRSTGVGTRPQGYIHAKLQHQRQRTKRYADGQNGYATHSAHYIAPSKRSKVIPVNVVVMVTGSFSVNKLLKAYSHRATALMLASMFGIGGDPLSSVAVSVTLSEHNTNNCKQL